MAFAKGTPIFTDNGWKKIEDISGHDRVLVRNFLGDAEFIQPFALKKSQFNGEIVKIGAKDWCFSVTPDHLVVYDRDKYGRGRNFKSVAAKDFEASKNNRIYRKFKYMFADEAKKESIVIRDEFGKRTSTISPYDWYILVGYVLCRGFIKTGSGKPMLHLFLDETRADEELEVIGNLIDQIGVPWHVQYSEKTRPKIVVSSKNTLARRLITRLGSSKRKEMRLPDVMIYNSTKELAKLLIETVKFASTTASGRFQLVTTNKALIDSLTLLGTLSGYSIRHSLLAEAGREVRGTITKKDSYILNIFDPVDTYSPTFVKKLPYNDTVYEIDLFEGQVYVKEGAMPVWVNPK